MKGKLALSIALALGIVLVSLTTLNWTVGAEPPQRFVWDTGLIKVGAGQLPIMSVTGDFNPDGSVDAADYVFRRFEYAQGPCTSDGVCRQAIQSQTVSDPIRLLPGQAASIVVDPSDPTGSTYVRAVVVSNKRSARVSAAIIDTVTGKTVSHIIVANTDGDIH